MPKYAEVVVDSITTDIEGTNIYDYAIPEKFQGMIKTGMRIIVPFGSRKVEGYVINVKDNSGVDEHKIKFVDSIPDMAEVFNEKGIKLAKWMSEEYMCSLTDALQCIMPSEISIKENKFAVLHDIPKENVHTLSDGKKRIIEEIKNNNGIMEVGKLSRMGIGTLKDLKDLANLNILSIKSKMEQDVKDASIRTIELNIACDEAAKLAESMEVSRTTKPQADIIKVLCELKGPVAEKELVETYSFSRSTVSTLIRKNIVRAASINISRDPYAGVSFEKMEKPSLSGQQNDVLHNIISRFRGGERNFLIHGVTGSGKTEIYMRLIENFINEGKQAIMLVPEISLTPQTIERFKGRFNRVAVIHSRLSPGEKYDEWKKIKNGEVDVVVGARSAVFAPFSNLGIIIIDEEHESSYKSDKTPKYITKEVAYKRCEIENALLILGSATPSVDTYFETLSGRYIKCSMDKRVEDKKMPYIELVDMRQEIMAGNKTIFSRKLYDELNKALEGGHQIILFLNRRGFSTFVSCRKCGLVMKCPRCDVSLTYHADINMLNCHYCGYAVKSPDICPSCKSKYIKFFGIGTEKLEGEVKRFFPSARVLRMDLDTTSQKGAHGRIYNAFKNKEADILIGTQMISKGLDFPDVTLVGIMAADQSLNMPDYRSSERTFQLITQVSGRAGRGKHEGKVIVQTYDPDHYSILSALHQDYDEFYNKEIVIRNTFMYPPLTKLLNIIVSSKIDKEAQEVIGRMTETIKNMDYDSMNISILGPSPAPISKINMYYRWQTIIKGKVDTKLKNQIKTLVNSIYMKNKRIRISVDMNPVNML